MFAVYASNAILTLTIMALWAMLILFVVFSAVLIIYGTCAIIGAVWRSGRWLMRKAWGPPA